MVTTSPAESVPWKTDDRESVVRARKRAQTKPPRQLRTRVPRTPHYQHCMHHQSLVQQNMLPVHIYAEAPIEHTAEEIRGNGMKDEISQERSWLSDSCTWYPANVVCYLKNTWTIFEKYILGISDPITNHLWIQECWCSNTISKTTVQDLSSYLYCIMVRTLVSRCKGWEFDCRSWYTFFL